MPTSDRFKPIQKIASHRERTAATALGESLKRHEAARQRLEELRQYLAEYLERFARAAHNGLSSSQILEYQVFIGKLETAIRQQEEVVARAQRACDSSKAQWRGRYSKSKAMQNAVGRLREQESRRREKSEQNEADDRAPPKR